MFVDWAGDSIAVFDAATGVENRARIFGSRRIWDVEELDLAFKSLPRENGEGDPAFHGDSDTSSWADFG